MNFSSVILRGRQLFHTTYKLYMISLLCEVFYLLITCIAYGKYAEDGRENNGLKVFGKVYIFSSFSPPPLVAKKSCIIKWVNVDYDLATIPKRPNKISQDPNSTRIYPIWCAFFFQFFVDFLGFSCVHSMLLRHLILLFVWFIFCFLYTCPLQDAPPSPDIFRLLLLLLLLHAILHFLPLPTKP